MTREPSDDAREILRLALRRRALRQRERAEVARRSRTELLSIGAFKSEMNDKRFAEDPLRREFEHNLAERLGMLGEDKES